MATMNFARAGSIPTEPRSNGGGVTKAATVATIAPEAATAKPHASSTAPKGLPPPPDPPPLIRRRERFLVLRNCLFQLPRASAVLACRADQPRNSSSRCSMFSCTALVDQKYSAHLRFVARTT